MTVKNKITANRVSMPATQMPNANTRQSCACGNG